MAWFGAESNANAVLLVLIFREDIIRQKAFPCSFEFSFEHKAPIFSAILILYAEMLANHNRGHLHIGSVPKLQNEWAS